MSDASPSNAPPPRRWHRRPTFWLLLVLAILLSVPVAWFVARRQQLRQARIALARDGGHVVYDHSPRGKWQNKMWLWRIAARSEYGDGILWDPYQVSFYPTNATDETLRHLALFRNAEVLSLGETHITDAGLVHLAEFQNLKLLNLNDTQITDAGVVHLLSLKQLEVLSIQGTGITPAGVAKLRQSLGCAIYSGPPGTTPK